MTRRLLGEWEEQSYVQLCFPHKNTDWNDYLDEMIPVFDTIANIIAKYQKCLVCFEDEATIKNIKNNQNIIFKKVSTDDTWCRDFGAITIEENDSLQLLDFTFNGWGNKFNASKDNDINKQIFNDTKKIDFVLEGGSIDSNGSGVILTTSDCLLEKNRNPQFTKKQIEQKLKFNFGAKKIIWLNHGFLEGDDTDSHIDMLARFVDSNTISYVKCDDKNDVHYEELSKMEEELKQTKFNLVPLPWISPKYYDNERLPASYANFLIINGAVLVPTYSDKNDEKALNIFRELFPDRDIIDIDCSKIIRQHGSLHCLTMQYYH
ncbi:MAG: agmatine deiminase family protein [Campylobacteraceae bacterium]|jgi:agmatine/peptidylarginine deiminase|nr:agmatine deiminase family protein [Campylobacteraceae bacterium]MBT3882220.1 agmatine deiminase family protein [Campylobacteraceae bacterium]MBT4030626.1 agmatine deiminase family protein [Campylobacteraceae bacterium]MBT4178794.1 agmatine deiminase family protein [Campylobacteraceae bacterium]MBT4571941.1 agmatine deiminase family protein [Campylobacteraceae bacterium]